MGDNGNAKTTVEVEQIKDEEIAPILKKVANNKGIGALTQEIEKGAPLSASKLQRYLQIGFQSASIILDYLVQIGALSKPDNETRIRSYINKKLVVDTLNNNK